MKPRILSISSSCASDRFWDSRLQSSQMTNASTLTGHDLRRWGPVLGIEILSLACINYMWVLYVRCIEVHVYLISPHVVVMRSRWCRFFAPEASLRAQQIGSNDVVHLIFKVPTTRLYAATDESPTKWSETTQTYIYIYNIITLILSLPLSLSVLLFL